MGEQSTGNAFTRPFQAYKRLYRAHPVLFPVVSVVVILAYLFVLNLVFPAQFDFARFFRARPQLQILLGTTESYSVGSNKLVLKRIVLRSRRAPLQNLRVTIRGPSGMEVASVFSQSGPETVRSTLPGDPVSVSTVASRVLTPDDVFEIVLRIPELSDRSGTIVVEATGTDATGHVLGTSATGSVDRGGR